MPTKPTEGSFVAIMRLSRGKAQILLAERKDGKGLNLIGGRLEENELPIECAVRETREETGLVVRVRTQIGGNLSMMNDDREITDIARVYRAKVLGGVLRDSNESDGFQWVGIEDLPDLKVVRRSCPGYLEGRTFAMIQMALADSDAVYSNVSDPEGLAVG